MSRTLGTAALVAACFFIVAILLTRHGPQTIDGTATSSIIIEGQ